ncbi:MAG: DUF2235 domain-containing protein [Erythrobacter sp.]
MAEQCDNKPDLDEPPRNIVVMCDGTGNEVEVNLSNVLKLFRMTIKNDLQLVFYDAGIGTIGNYTAWQRRRQEASAVFALATGYGLDANLARTYAWLCENWREGDRIWLFGFSRGAYTVRALGGLIHMLGVVRPDQSNLAGYAVGAYRRMAESGDFETTDNFRRVTGARRAAIHFMGVWDTVASVIVPHWDRMQLLLEHLPHTARNPSVGVVRHALAIDEKRRMFRPRIWTDPQEFVPNPFIQGPHAAQDIQQVWFAGCHGDIGGGYPEEDSGLSKFSLIWMVEEAIKQGLDIRKQSLNWLGHGRQRKDSKREFSPPDAAAKIHNSLKGPWGAAELVPKRVRYREWEQRRSILGYYLPRGEPRFIPENASIHSSVIDRYRQVPDYCPPNLPDLMRVVDGDVEQIERENLRKE